MNYFITFDSEISIEAVDQMLNKLNDVNNIGQQIGFENMELTIYFNSEGGYCHSAQFMVDALNRTAANIKTTILVCGSAMSAAIDILLDFQGDIIIHKNAVGMVHRSSTNIATKGLKSKTSYSSFLLKHDVEINHSYLNRIRKSLTEEQIASYNSGEEVYLSNLQLTNLLAGNSVVPSKKPKKTKK